MCFRIRAYLLVLFASAFAALGAGPAAADNVFTQNGVGVSGYDPVAYFADGKALLGSAQFTAEYHGIAYKFASAAHRDAFTADPEKYLPQYGGYCAYAAAKGALAKTDPEAFTVLNGKLYLNFSEDIRQRWLPRSTEFIHAADLNWPQLRGQ
jgi:YHS domain-containing protein